MIQESAQGREGELTTSITDHPPQDFLQQLIGKSMLEAAWSQVSPNPAILLQRERAGQKGPGCHPAAGAQTV